MDHAACQALEGMLRSNISALLSSRTPPRDLSRSWYPSFLKFDPSSADAVCLGQALQTQGMRGPFPRNFMKYSPRWGAQGGSILPCPKRHSCLSWTVGVSYLGGLAELGNVIRAHIDQPCCLGVSKLDLQAARPHGLQELARRRSTLLGAVVRTAKEQTYSQKDFVV
jgi:hypothetical protein